MSAEEEEEDGMATRETKKKNKKRKKANGSTKEEPAAEIARIVREVNELLGEPVACTGNSATVVRSAKHINLSVQRKHLNPLNEFKRICGGKGVQLEERYVRVSHYYPYSSDS